GGGRRGSLLGNLRRTRNRRLWSECTRDREPTEEDQQRCVHGGSLWHRSRCCESVSGGHPHDSAWARSSFSRDTPAWSRCCAGMLHRTPRRLVALGLFTLVACQDSNDSPADGSTGPVDGGTTTGGYTTSTSSSSTTEDPHPAGPETGSSSSDGSGGEQDESTDATGEDHASTGEVVSELDGLWQTEGYG